MIRPILISLSPNTEADDISLAWQLLWQPWRAHQVGPIKQLEQQLSSYFNDRPVIAVSSGRRALYDILRAYSIGAGDEVIVQAFTCVAVPAPVSWAGATPIYADLKPGTYHADPAAVAALITPKTKAIVIQHTFGLPGPLKELQALAAKHDLVLIEDCAHSLGAQIVGQPLGTFGEVALLSFGRDKALSSVFGGAVVCRDETIATKIRQAQDTLPYPPYWWIKQQLNHVLLFAFITQWYFTLGLGEAVLVVAQKLHLVSKAVAPIEKQGQRPNHLAWRLAPFLAQLALKQWAKLDRYTARRRAIAQKYNEALNLGFTSSQLEQASWLRVPVRVADPQKVLLEARQHRMLLGDWYDAPVVPGVSGASVKYQTGSCPVAQDVADHILNLPTYPQLTDEQVSQVIDFIKPYVIRN